MGQDRQAVDAPIVREVRPQPTGKWCSYCRKHDHNDAECWCTRAVGTDWKPTPIMSLEIFREASAAAARDRAERIEAALVELVALREPNFQPYAEYQERVRLAWEAAERVLGPNVRAKPPEGSA